MLETLGQYKILDRIGVGGIGEVYRARDTQLGRTVAIKLLTADVSADGELRERFLRDANATMALSHPNIAALYEIGDEQGYVFLVFEFAPGDRLNAVIAGRAINPRRAINLGIQIADALADAHAAGILHGDIKPDNIIVTPKGNAKILDLGLSDWTGGGELRRAAAAMTADSADTAARATVPYMSPEQALGGQVDERTDIFSLGTVMFEMLTGRLPFNASTSSALAMQIVQAAPPAPSTLNRALPREIDAIVGKALAKSLERRYESAATLAAELRSVATVLDMRSETAQPPGVVPFHAQKRSYARWIVAALLLLAALAAAAWWQR
jgi:eukaryotic-like serine/threonine-protein kinase